MQTSRNTLRKISFSSAVSLISLFGGIISIPVTVQAQIPTNQGCHAGQGSVCGGTNTQPTTEENKQPQNFDDQQVPNNNSNSTFGPTRNTNNTNPGSDIPEKVEDVQEIREDVDQTIDILR